MLSSELSTGRAGGNRSSCNTKKWTHSYNYTLHRVCAMGVTAVVSGNMVTAITLSVVFVSGVLAACPGDSDLFITAPKKMEALNGSCLQIPCSFTFRSEQEFDGSRKTFGVWIKSNPFFGSKPENVIFNSSETVKTYPMRITGNLSEKDCTTLFSSLLTSYTDRYYFRAENRPLVATDICESVQIRVQDSPPRPRIEISGEISGDLKEEQSVTITCSAVTPCPHSPPQLTWSLQQDTRNNTEENADGTFTTKIQETITLSDQHDGNNITCSATYPVNEGKDVRTAQETKTLSVSYAPKDTSVSISPSGLVSAGSWVNLTCSSRAKPPVSFSWFRISKDGPTLVSEGHFYSFNVTEGGVYYCVATNELGNHSSIIRIDIEGAPAGSQWQAVVGGIIGIMVLIGLLVVLVWLLKKKRSAPQQTPQQTQSQTEAGEENIHYGEIDFSKRRPEPSSSSVRDSRQQEDTLYAQVNTSKPANSSTPTAGGTDDIYAQVKKQ
uniref:myelin-associated glycoprotein-like isoform X2 n=1 Tax=Scatophagus argus TaxID=75038 RepID=UPI001ED7CBF6|nr:myelin-associated glycoprotein-like isoform X2 [Scatophagus argus]